MAFKQYRWLIILNWLRGHKSETTSILISISLSVKEYIEERETETKSKTVSLLWPRSLKDIRLSHEAIKYLYSDLENTMNWYFTSTKYMLLHGIHFRSPELKSQVSFSDHKLSIIILSKSIQLSENYIIRLYFTFQIYLLSCNKTKRNAAFDRLNSRLYRKGPLASIFGR